MMLWTWYLINKRLWHLDARSCSSPISPLSPLRFPMVHKRIVYQIHDHSIISISSVLSADPLQQWVFKSSRSRNDNITNIRPIRFDGSSGSEPSDRVSGLLTQSSLFTITVTLGNSLFVFALPPHPPKTNIMYTHEKNNTYMPAAWWQ